MIRSTVFLLVELLILFMGVAFFVELIQRKLGPERLRAWMGGSPIQAALKGIAVGFITPFCTYSAVPLLIGLRGAGVPPAGYTAFIVAAPVLDPVLFGALILIVGVNVAVTYAAVAFTAALALALIAQRVGIERFLKPLPRVPAAVGATTSSTDYSDYREGEDGCESTNHSPWRGWRAEVRSAARNTNVLLRSFGPLVVLGVGIGLAIETFVSPDTVAGITGDNTSFAIPIAAMLGTPLYFSTELFVPIADSLHAAGIGAGAIVALTIAGAGANVPEFIILSRLAQPRLISIFFGYVFAVAAMGGVLAQMIAT